MPRTLLDLPAELILYILEAASDSADLFSLILTSPGFASVWRTHAATIAPKVLARSVECYSEAQQLDIACYMPPQKVNTASDLIRHPTFEEAAKFHKRILTGARAIDSLYTCFLADVQFLRPFEHLATAEERQSTKRALYYLWRLVRASSFSPRKAGQCIISLPLNLNIPQFHDTLPLCKILDWVHHNGTSSSRLQKLIMKTHKIYGLMDKVRYAHPQRWLKCCEALWRADAFRLSRRKYWNSVGLETVGPL